MFCLCLHQVNPTAGQSKLVHRGFTVRRYLGFSGLTDCACESIANGVGKEEELSVLTFWDVKTHYEPVGYTLSKSGDTGMPRKKSAAPLPDSEPERPDFDKERLSSSVMALPLLEEMGSGPRARKVARKRAAPSEC